MDQFHPVTRERRIPYLFARGICSGIFDFPAVPLNRPVSWQSRQITIHFTPGCDIIQEKETGLIRQKEDKSMRNYPADLERIFSDYRADMENCGKKYKPADGLFGITRSVKDDECHDRFDRRVEELIREFVSSETSSGIAGQLTEMLLFPDRFQDWPVSAQWMLRAAERHSASLIPLLSPDTAEAVYRRYTLRYPPRDRLPVQKKICRALFSKCPGCIK